MTSATNQLRPAGVPHGLSPVARPRRADILPPTSSERVPSLTRPRQHRRGQVVHPGQYLCVRAFRVRFRPVMETQSKTASDRPCGLLEMENRPAETDSDHRSPRCPAVKLSSTSARWKSVSGQGVARAAHAHWGRTGTIIRWCSGTRRAVRCSEGPEIHQSAFLLDDAVSCPAVTLPT